MKKFVKISIMSGIILSIQTAVAIPAESEVNQTEASKQTSNQMIELLASWGFNIVECQENVINIKHDVTGEIGCAVPNKKLQAGNFIYNSDDNTISPITTQPRQASQPETEPASPAQIETKPSNSGAKAQDSRIEEIVFDFNNAYDYGVCLDVILLAYEGRNTELEKVSKNECATNVLNVFGNNISKDIALELIKSANFHATEVLGNKLYPSLGIRRRVAINLGYVYDIDKNNSDILKYVDSAEK